MSVFSDEMKCIKIQNAVYALSRTGLDISQKAVNVIRENKPEKVDRLFELCSDLMATAENRFPTYQETIANAMRWCSIKNQVTAELGQ